MHLQILLTIAAATCAAALPQYPEDDKTWPPSTSDRNMQKLHIPAAIVVSNDKDCEPHDHEFHYGGQKIYDVNAGECHNLNKINAKSFKFRAPRRPMDVVKHGCRIVMFSDRKCKDELLTSMPVVQGWSFCQNFHTDVYPASVMMRCHKREGGLYGSGEEHVYGTG